MKDATTEELEKELKRTKEDLRARNEEIEELKELLRLKVGNLKARDEEIQELKALLRSKVGIHWEKERVKVPLKVEETPEQKVERKSKGIGSARVVVAKKRRRH
mmetsp:Transcript_13766/g.26444  ORF Transcript_13766/g.26444 Transcript_13766/m.26444 type:complete len:104 (+) Transcript_13766:165-476(+)